jgi:hypothetical protein
LLCHWWWCRRSDWTLLVSDSNTVSVIESFPVSIFFDFYDSRNAIVVSMILQLMASALMIVTLEIYYGYDKGDPSRAEIIQVLQMKDVAVTFLYISRFLSGCSAGESSTYILRDSSFERV